ncbi:MAG: hypothetical protein JW942_01590 [Opitutales bacterium]|nr:hypothetical protein [Opitutales bacterium]
MRNRKTIFLLIATSMCCLLAIVPILMSYSLSGPVKVLQRQDYKGWNDAIVMSNGIVEVVIVPSISRVMQFRFIDDADGPFWNNPELEGQYVEDSAWLSHPGSYGGDKIWPAPQSDWSWPPPPDMDNGHCDYRVLDDMSVELSSPVSRSQGVLLTRRISLSPDKAEMHIESSFRKVEGEPSTVSVWTITQAKQPLALYMELAKLRVFKDGYLAMQGDSAKNVRVENGLLRLLPDASQNQKIGNDGSRILWVGEDDMLMMEMPRKNAVYPDNGCSMELYTNAAPLEYVELETLSPLARLSVGDTLQETTTYTLFKRKSENADQDAKEALGVK